mgnify:CR=1 FL=1
MKVTTTAIQGAAEAHVETEYKRFVWVGLVIGEVMGGTVAGETKSGGSGPRGGG